MLPYLQVGDLDLGPVSLSPFALLVAVGLAVMALLLRRRGRWLGLDSLAVDTFFWWVVFGGALGGHVLDAVFYTPDAVLRRPWSLLFLWEGQGSFGGFAGAVAGGFLWRRRTGQPLLPYTDALLSVFPIAWIFGRAGCAIIHDHPGVRTSAGNPLAVAYPDGARYDLGLLEMLLAVLISIVVVATWRRRLRPGAYVAMTTLVYAPVRFGLDFLRVGEVRLLGLTPGQYGCVALAAVGLWALRRARRSPAT